MTTSLVVATDRPALVAAHRNVGAWIHARRDALAVELGEAREALAKAKERKWATETLDRLVKNLEKHEVFLDKVAGAIEAGYTIVPNFDFEQLAVRTARSVPGGSDTSQPRIGAARLPAGAGEFVSPEPYFTSWETEEKRGERTVKVTIFQATDHAPVDVPFALMKRDLADALHAAMQEKLFDEIGIVRDTPKGDPVLVGRINHPKKINRWDRRGVTFFIGWWFDVRTLDV